MEHYNGQAASAPEWNTALNGLVRNIESKKISQTGVDRRFLQLISSNSSMSLVPFTSLPDSSRIWIFAADRTLSEHEAKDLLTMLDVYLENWKAHGAPVRASRDLQYRQFIIIAADPEVTAPSGCSIDDMTHAIRSLGEKFQVEFFNTMTVFFLDQDTVRHVTRAEFRTLADRGEVTGATIVFNNAITSLREYRDGAWELPARDSWHAALLPQFQHA